MPAGGGPTNCTYVGSLLPLPDRCRSRARRGESGSPGVGSVVGLRDLFCFRALGFACGKSSCGRECLPLVEEAELAVSIFR
eukprot:COSAG02_NODE_858_length_16456_cov_7.419698_12_plen_81_part_00